MIEKLRNINDDILKKTKDDDTKNKHLLIKMILLDDECFFKIGINDSYAILRDLGIPEEDLEYIYKKLIDEKERKDD